MPYWGGVEGAGHVVELGAGASNAKVGDLVNLARVEGVWGEEVIVPSARLNAFPAEADPLQVAMLTVNPPTAELMLTDFVDLEAGDWVIQNTANGAVGKTLAMLAAARGVHIVNLVRRDAGVEELAALGIANAVSTATDGWQDRVRAITGDAPIRAAVDSIGGQASAELLSLLGEDGLLVSLAQDTWLIKITQYRDSGGQLMPRRLSAISGENKIRLVIDNWVFR